MQLQYIFSEQMRVRISVSVNSYSKHGRCRQDALLMLVLLSSLSYSANGAFNVSLLT